MTTSKTSNKKDVMIDNAIIVEPIKPKIEVEAKPPQIETTVKITKAEKLYNELEKQYGTLVAWYLDSVLKHFTRLNRAQLNVYLNTDNIFNLFTPNFHDVVLHSLMTLKLTAKYSGRQFSNSTMSTSFDSFLNVIDFGRMYNTNHHEIFQIDNKITYFDRNGSLYSIQRKDK